jgi:hypothetical protein
MDRRLLSKAELASNFKFRRYIPRRELASNFNLTKIELENWTTWYWYRAACINQISSVYLLGKFKVPVRDVIPELGDQWWEILWRSKCLNFLFFSILARDCQGWILKIYSLADQERGFAYLRCSFVRSSLFILLWV